MISKRAVVGLFKMGVSVLMFTILGHPVSRTSDIRLILVSFKTSPEKGNNNNKNKRLTYLSISA